MGLQNHNIHHNLRNIVMHNYKVSHKSSFNYNHFFNITTFIFESILAFSDFLAHTRPIFLNLNLLPLCKVVLQGINIFM